MTYIDGSYFRTNNFTVDDITDALESGKRWIELQNGGRINLGYVIHYEPYKFFDLRNYCMRYRYICQLLFAVFVAKGVYHFVGKMVTFFYA